VISLPPWGRADLLRSRSDALRRNAYLAALRHIGRGASGSAFPRGTWERVITYHVLRITRNHMNKILVTPRVLTRELLCLLPGCVGMLAGAERISARVLEAAKELKAISRNGTGVDNIDLEAAERLNIRILRAEGANARGVAELAIGLVLAGVRAIPYSDAQMKTGNWSRKKGMEIDGRTLGLIGCGKIGKLVAQMALGLGMTVIAYDLYPDQTFTPSPKFRFAALDMVLQMSDVISLHCPPKQDGTPIIDKEAITHMKKGVYLMNTARPSLIDEEAVLKALNSGQIAGFATDVFHKEPPEISELFSHKNVITTPHIGGFTVESVVRAAQAAVENLLQFLGENVYDNDH
jgi:D-3-phosphoglycerate dehydrogenase